MVKISCEGESSIEVLSHLKGFASLISSDVPTNTGMMPENIATLAAKPKMDNHTSSAPVISAPVVPTSFSYIPAPQPVPATPPAPPVTAAPAYTHEQVGKAGADLVAANPGMMPTLLGLLQKYGVQLVTDLKPDQLGTFAGELRALGAKI